MYIDKIEKYIGKKEYFTARAAYYDMKRKYPDCETDETGQKLKSAFISIDTLIMLAAVSSKVEFAALCLSQVEKRCSDFTGRNEILKKFTPEKPLFSDVRPFENYVMLKWSNIEADKSVTYKVIRKKNRDFSAYEGKDVIASDLTECFFCDNSPKVGIEYFYGVVSSLCISGTGLFLDSEPDIYKDGIKLIPDVSDVLQLPGDSSGISVKWKAPEEVCDITVIKKAGKTPPENAEDGTRLSSVTKDGFNDTACDGGYYSYLITCRYVISGNPVLSHGVKYTAKKMLVPETPSEINIKEDATIYSGDKAIFTVEAIGCKNGTVSFMSSDGEPKAEYGVPFKTESFSALCPDFRHVPSEKATGESYNISIPNNTCVYIYPLVANEDLFTVGKPFILNSIRAVSDVRASVEGYDVRIEGRFYNGAKKIIAAVDESRYTVRPDGYGKRIELPIEKVISDGSVRIPLSPGEYFITLFAEYEFGGENHYTKGIDLKKIEVHKRIVVRFIMKYNVSVQRQFKVDIDFTVNEDDSNDIKQPFILPNMVLVAGKHIPITKNDGDIIKTVCGIGMKKSLLKKGFHGNASFFLPKAKYADMKIRLFLNEENSGRIKLRAEYI